MARQTKTAAKTAKTNTRAKKAATKSAKKSSSRVKKSESAEVIPDAYKEFKNGDVEISLYERENERVNAKVVLCGCFVIYARVVIMEDYAFLAYPSFKTKKGDFVNQAYCFDKELNEEINNFVSAYIFDELENEYDEDGVPFE